MRLYKKNVWCEHDRLIKARLVARLLGVHAALRVHVRRVCVVCARVRVSVFARVCVCARVHRPRALSTSPPPLHPPHPLVDLPVTSTIIFQAYVVRLR